MDRRSFFRVVAGVAALPILAKLPAPVAEMTKQIGAWATARIEGGAITSITIINAGSGYLTPPVVSLFPTQKED